MIRLCIRDTFVYVLQVNKKSSFAVSSARVINERSITDVIASKLFKGCSLAFLRVCV